MKMKYLKMKICQPQLKSVKIYQHQLFQLRQKDGKKFKQRKF